MITFKHSGSFNNSEIFLGRNRDRAYRVILEKYGALGVDALASATPIDSGITSESWGYEITQTKGRHSITWTNNHVVDGVIIAVVIQYGHATRSGGYVEGRDFINPVMKPIFDLIAENLYKEVSDL